ncbi:hypothetical protein [Peribacillus muralis]|uniref:hypothetical protein n=1 Tax=Peribacillus muralis TaxID=264697 RepID=UPI00070C8D7F|nr:hypothetical protein [Peribacillus muralis]MCK1994967.1 hypothetical protein [Peribacillus muralis]MCK2015487.1 hypothetical protein [Peribacillus muralis]
MKMYKLVKDESFAYKKGTKFFLISHSEFIGVKSYVLLAENLQGKIEITEEELSSKFVSIY